jgi:predicted DNA-binding protein with PD1-like motif
MKYQKINNGYILKLEKGDEIMATLTKFCVDNNINSGSVTGIGGTNDAVIKYYNLEKKEYIPKRFNGLNYEIVSLNGNISSIDEKPILHLHITLGDSDYRIFGGHLESAVIAVTGEIIIYTSADDVVRRKMDEEFKLNFLDL